jgi:hypothetical protein
MRNMQTLATRKDERSDAQALASVVSLRAALDISSSAIGVRQVRASGGEGDSSSRNVAGCNAYVLESGIERPERLTQGRPLSQERELMCAMEVGQSFLLTDHGRYEYVRSIQTRLKPKKFSTRKQDGGWRVWRLE